MSYAMRAFGAYDVAAGAGNRSRPSSQSTNYGPVPDDQFERPLPMAYQQQHQQNPIFYNNYCCECPANYPRHPMGDFPLEKAEDCCLYSLDLIKALMEAASSNHVKAVAELVKSGLL